VSLLDDAARVESLNVLSRFRTDFHRCLTARADALFELTDAVHRRAGQDAGRPGAGARAPARPRCPVRRAELRPDRPGPATRDAGRPAAAADQRRQGRARRRCEPMAALGCAHQCRCAGRARHRSGRCFGVQQCLASTRALAWPVGGVGTLCPCKCRWRPAQPAWVSCDRQPCTLPIHHPTTTGDSVTAAPTPPGAAAKTPAIRRREPAHRGSMRSQGSSTTAREDDGDARRDQLVGSKRTITASMRCAFRECRSPCPGRRSATRVGT
jgi:hypothetical protein